MKKVSILPLLFIALLSSIVFIQSCKKNDPDSCNGKNTRREIKLAIDDAASEIDITPISISVEEIGQLSVDEVEKTSERQAIEKKVYTITAKVHKLSKHRDGDWKVKLTDEDDKYINCESPNPGCEFVGTSVFLNNIQSVREWIETNKDNLVGETVPITGVAFIDIDHKYPRNAADNELELHPILDIHF
ncbi:MAG: hypothetical protein P8P74_04445 [Crocinitomicaceae bacterium]|nr:hypothetical protein [Crocinitomicaceae bacterium]